jgi:DNA polymerase III subunit epsilon
MKLEELIKERDLVVFDLETTGTSPRVDRIVQFAGVRVFADGRGRETLELKVNPEMPIPKGASDVHGITDEDVKNAPKLIAVADRLITFFDGADLGGYNVISYDLPLLRTELERVGRTLEVQDRRVVDGMVIFKIFESRSLEAALRFYCDEEHETAHDALGDVRATIDVIQAQLDRYERLPKDMEGLTEMLLGRRVTFDGKLVWQDGKACFGFGKHQGVPLQTMVRRQRGYLEWVLGSDFPDDVKTIIRRALEGQFPTPTSS